MNNQQKFKKEALECWTATQVCYCKALLETYPEILKGFDPKQFGVFGQDRAMKEYLLELGLLIRSEDIHRRYMAHILNLTTQQLNKIIETNEKGIIKRAPETIDEISYELLNRAVKENEKK